MKKLRNTAFFVGSCVLLCIAEPALAIGHPGLGRFAQRDPLGYVDGANLYEYVRGNPLANLDPTGTISKSEEKALLEAVKNIDNLICKASQEKAVQRVEELMREKARLLKKLGLGLAGAATTFLSNPSTCHAAEIDNTCVMCVGLTYTNIVERPTAFSSLFGRDSISHSENIQLEAKGMMSRDACRKLCRQEGAPRKTTEERVAGGNWFWTVLSYDVYDCGELSSLDGFISHGAKYSSVER